MTARRRSDAPENDVTRTSLVIPRGLLARLKAAVTEERTDVSTLLCRLAEDYLKARKGGRR